LQRNGKKTKSLRIYCQIDLEYKSLEVEEAFELLLYFFGLIDLCRLIDLGKKFGSLTTLADV
jgi:hypothetical protein